MSCGRMATSSRSSIRSIRARCALGTPLARLSVNSRARPLWRKVRITSGLASSDSNALLYIVSSNALQHASSASTSIAHENCLWHCQAAPQSSGAISELRQAAGATAPTQELTRFLAIRDRAHSTGPHPSPSPTGRGVRISVGGARQRGGGVHQHGRGLRPAYGTALIQNLSCAVLILPAASKYFVCHSAAVLDSDWSAPFAPRRLTV